MHVLILPSWYPLHENDLNGCFFREQAHALAKKGTKVGVIIPQFRSLRLGKKAICGKYNSEIWQDGDISTYFTHDVFWFPKIPYIDLNRWINAGLNLFEKYIKEQGVPDIIHVHSLLLAGPLALAIHKKYQIPYCVTEHSSLYARGLIKNWEWKYLNNSAQSARKLLAVSKSLTDILESKFSNTKWDIFPNLLDNIFTESSQRDFPTRKEQLCAVGFLNKNKGFDLLIKAFAKVLQYSPQLKLCIGGDCPEKENLQNIIMDLKLENSVFLLGSLARKDVCKLMSESKCFILSSHVETFGIVVIEALSQGTPVIATLCGGPNSLLTPNDGVFVKPNDEADLAKGIMEYLNNQDKFDHRKIRERCISNYSEAAFAEKLMKIYTEIHS